MLLRQTSRRSFITGFALVSAGLLFSTGIQTGPQASAYAPSPVRYRLDPGQSRFMVKVFVGGLLKAFGHDHNIAIRDYSGEVQITPESITPASFQITIKADSLAVTDKVSESDRRKIETTMREEVLETGKYPEIVFKSTSAAVEKTGEGKYNFKLWGELALHGVKSEGYIVGKLTLAGDTLRATGGFPLHLSNYKMKQVSVAGGTIKVKDETRFTFDLVAKRQ